MAELVTPELVERLFPQFDHELRDVIVKNGVIKKYAPGEEIMHTGQTFRSSMIVTRGRVKVYRDDADGGEFFMYYIEPGEACALSLICAARNEESMVMARATEETEMIAIPLGLMDTLMTQHKSWYYFVLATYRNRFEELLSVISSIAFRNMDERLEYYLLRQQKALGTSKLHTTHEAIANDLNSSRVVISRLMKQLEQEGKIRQSRNVIEIIDLDEDIV